MTFKPMLAATVEDIGKLNYPLLASPKLDGIRATVINGTLVSRNLKPIPNRYLQKRFGFREYEGLDGELIMGSCTSESVFRDTTSAVMSHDGEPDVKFWVFDNHSFGGPFDHRFELLKRSISNMSDTHLRLVPHELVEDIEELDSFEQYHTGLGYEGVMLRSLHGLYKFGRSTLREQGLMKLKRFTDAEAIIVGFEEQMQNTNVQTRDKLGRAERSNHKAGMKGKGTLGSLRVRGINGTFKGVEFSIGSGMNDELRQQIWDNQEDWDSLVVKYKFFEVGSKDAPRFPVYLGTRSDL